MSNVYNPTEAGLSDYTEIPVATFTITAGVYGWIDTDVSATTGTDTDKVWLVWGGCASSQLMGALPHGSASTGCREQAVNTTFLSKVDSTGHMDFLRNATNDAVYHLGGYFS